MAPTNAARPAPDASGNGPRNDRADKQVDLNNNPPSDQSQALDAAEFARVRDAFTTLNAVAQWALTSADTIRSLGDAPLTPQSAASLADNLDVAAGNILGAVRVIMGRAE